MPGLDYFGTYEEILCVIQFVVDARSFGVRIRHVETWYHFVCEYIEDGFMKIEITPSVESNSKLFTIHDSRFTIYDSRFTKNVNHELYKK